LSVESEVGVGSTFSVRIPIEYGAHPAARSPTTNWQMDPTRLPVLLVEESPESVSMYAKLLKGTGFQMLATETVADAREALRTATPVAVVLDVLSDDGRMWELLADLKRDPATRTIPVLVATAADERKTALAMTGVGAVAVRPIDRSWLLRHLRAAQRRSPREQVLIIDDDDVSRYVLQGMLADTRFGVMQATSGTEGLHKARAERPRVIILDLAMPDLTGEEVIKELIADPETRDIPVIVYTAAAVADPISPALAHAVAILSKDAPDREAATTALRDALMRATRAVPSPATDRAAS
jgi:CheY-like chemotaxis protein